MNAGHLAARGRQRRALDLGGPVVLDGEAVPAMEFAARRVGALFRLCSVDLADTASRTHEWRRPSGGRSELSRQPMSPDGDD